jgi:predicted esterase
MAHAHYLQTQRTARYFTLGVLTENTSEIWLVLHGYAQLANDFIQPFEALNNGSRFIIAPEGLNRFYAKGFGGKPAATWMTSEDREHEIADYLFYLDRLTDHLIPADFKGEFHVLGFSQGVATASRWIHHSEKKVNRFMIYAGEIASELRHPLSEKLLQCAVTYITGNNDPLLKAEQKEPVMALMQELHAKVITFDGGHEMKAEVLMLLSA